MLSWTSRLRWVALDDDVVAALQQLNQPLEQAARECIVLELYRRGTISSGKAAELFACRARNS